VCPQLKNSSNSILKTVTVRQIGATSWVLSEIASVAISLGQDWFLNLLLWLTGIPHALATKDAGAIFSQTRPLKASSIPRMYHDLLQALGINSPCPELAVNVPKPDIDWAESQQKRLGIQEWLHPDPQVLANRLGLKALIKSTQLELEAVIQNFQQRQ